MTRTHSTLSNPAYSQLIVQLNLAKRHLEAVKSIADELVRDRMLTDECKGYRLQTMIDDVAYAEMRVRERSTS